ncbi:TIR domain-containing protein [Burkholderia ambifaria]|uniref:TIR domain-containing protein n=1 Tax=Burkholderia ambifaria TaxID=152480 RepID=UPI001C931C78|nr:TIR domain-containing protein [Burkholderia ambifaria]MBY4767334.1 toll/interleukin-1 receptor domain-containing protein [Burkholderia ambifaria]
MKVFISWSGPTSHQVAVALRDWLPQVVQSIKPYVSSEDIDKGARWSSDIAKELDGSEYGIVCLTQDNLTAPWINFEAGALGKSIDKSKVSPFLFRMERSQVQGPLVQFQFTVFERNDVFKLLTSINSAHTGGSLESDRLTAAFDVWWPKLVEKLAAISPSDPSRLDSRVDRSATTDMSDVLEELLDLTRRNHKILRDPASLLPAEYLSQVAPIRLRGMDISRPLAEIVGRFKELRECCSRARELSQIPTTPEQADLYDAVYRMEAAIRYISSDV